MLLRIEDTDVERSRQHHAEQIVASLQWLGIEWDEGPLFQTDRLDRYRERTEELIASGAAYRCYCTVEELDAEREAAEKAGRAYKYSGRCRAVAADERRREESHIVRFRVPAGPIRFRDLIRGDVEFEGETIDDFVLLRSDSYPTYHLSVVVDDIDMEITIVARGEDHLSNTPKHVLLFAAFRAPVPEFAHVPLILGSDRKRLSKRTGATSAEEYRDLGILPEALFNFLTLLGWSPGGDREILSKSECEQLFDLSDVNKSPAVFDDDKLMWLNGQYMAHMPCDELLVRLRPFLTIESDSDERLKRVVGLNQTRARTLRDLADLVIPYFMDDDSLQYEADAVSKHLKGADLQQRMHDLEEALEALDSFDESTTEAALRALAEKKGIGAGKYIHPLRVALMGKLASPPIFDVAVALGKERSLRRLRNLITRIPALVNA